MNGVQTFKITAQSDYDPKGPDGKGWNRLAILAITPQPRCGLRPKSKAAAMDLLRSHLHGTVWSSFGECIGSSCEMCRRVLDKRDPWHPSWIIREDEFGRLWLLTEGRGFESFGYCFSDWERLIRQIDVPMLQRQKDEHGFYFCAATEIPAHFQDRIEASA